MTFIYPSLAQYNCSHFTSWVVVFFIIIYFMFLKLCMRAEGLSKGDWENGIQRRR